MWALDDILAADDIACRLSYHAHTPESDLANL